jgi:hypothetical protein
MSIYFDIPNLVSIFDVSNNQKQNIMKQDTLFKVIGFPAILFSAIYLIVYIITVG